MKTWEIAAAIVAVAAIAYLTLKGKIPVSGVANTSNTSSTGPVPYTGETKSNVTSFTDISKSISSAFSSVGAKVAANTKTYNPILNTASDIESGFRGLSSDISRVLPPVSTAGTDFAKFVSGIRSGASAIGAITQHDIASAGTFLSKGASAAASDVYKLGTAAAADISSAASWLADRFKSIRL